MKYSATTNGFYDPAIHGDNIPGDAVEVSASDYVALMSGQQTGKVIVPNTNGYPVLADPAEPTTDQKKQYCKEAATARLLATDWSQYADVAESLLNQADFTAYRATVRALVIAPVPNPTWPDEPKAEWKV